MKDTFENYHPLVNFLYFAVVLFFSMIINHPIVQLISIICVITYSVKIEGKKSIFFILKFCLPMVILTAIINPAFNHEGTTILLYLDNGNPLTLESILYGISSGILLANTILWFFQFSRIMNSDKFIYLFGKIIPALSLVLSMSLRFIPKFKKQMQVITDAQRCIGNDIYNGNILKRTKTAIQIISIMITWSLENSIEVSDSMKSRGYGLKGRTSYSNYRLTERDIYLIIWISFCFLFILSGVLLNIFAFRFFPSIRYKILDLSNLPFYIILFILFITPLILNLREEKKWKTIYSKM